MPELPEVETVRLTLLPRVKGSRIEGFTVRRGSLRSPVRSRAMKTHLLGRTITALERRGKFLIFGLDSPYVLVLHLGMTGRLRIERTELPVRIHDCLLFHLAGGRDLRYEDVRRFGLAFCARREGLERHPALRGLGPEPLSELMTGEYLWQRGRGLRRPVKTFLMDARMVAGVGNIYASEVLFAARIHPARSVSRLSRESCSRLAECLRRILQEAIDHRGTSFSDYRDGNGRPGDFQHLLRVYGRSGQACSLCSGPIRRIVQAGRSTFYCPRCQH